jgi:hypothetical protein
MGITSALAVLPCLMTGKLSMRIHQNGFHMLELLFLEKY